MLANPPADQQARLRELRDLNVLDTAPEQEFDDVVNLASRICGMPISLISLVAEDRQWFKARTGLERDGTSIEEAMCAHAILENDFLEIPDTSLDQRTLDNPLVVNDNPLRFYAGAVLRSSKGHAVGTLCVLDNKPNKLTDLQRDTLRVLARQVMAQLELRRAISQAEILRREVDHRVKNSLQSVAALTRIQSRSTTHPETREALEVTGRRIETISVLHEILYAPQSEGQVAMEEFIPRVASLLEQAAPSGILIRADVVPLTMSSNRAAAVGVILNEFATNAFKHAFSSMAQGQIRFTLSDQPDHGLRLICSDNGGGIDGQIAGDPGLGLRIIEASAHQLGGKAVTISGAEGTTTTVTITPQAEN